MRGIRFSREARQELREAIDFYEQEAPGLGGRFYDELVAALELVREHPEIAPRVTGQIRRLVLPRFPYNLIYRSLSTSDLRVLAVAHHKRRPGYWTGRR